MSYLLSICIPTFNRANYLIENLNVIRDQIIELNTNDIEICISDNASTDKTEDCINRFICDNKELNIRYSKNKENEGPSKNYIKAMKMSNSKYGWLLSSDDVLLNGALKRILNHIKNNDDCNILIFNAIYANINLDDRKKRYWLNDKIEDIEIDFSDQYQVSYYLSNAKNTGAAFSYISSFIYNNEMMTQKEIDDAYYDTAYSFLFYVFSYLTKGKKVFYMREHLVLAREGNSTFASKLPQRILLDIDGYERIKNDFFHNDPINGELLMNLIKKTYPFYRIIKCYCILGKNKWNTFFVKKLKQLGWTEKELEMIKYFSNPFIVIIVRIKWFIEKYF